MSTILEQWQEGKGLPGVLVIDGHTHIYRWRAGWTNKNSQEVVSEALAFMDAYGVDAACVLSGGYMVNGADYRMGNRFLLECVRRAPERLIPFAHINPNDSQDRILAELALVEGEGVHAIKLLNAYEDYPGDGPNLMIVYAFAQEHNMLVLNHYWPEAEVRKIAAAFPGVNLIRGHGGASALSRELPNVYDNIWSLWPLGSIERGLQQNGPHKALYGSDAFQNDLSVGLGMVVYAQIPEEHKRMVLGLNMARLLDKVGALPTSLKKWL